MSERTQQIGERISFVRQPDEFTLIITQQIPRTKEAIFFAWMLALLMVWGVFIYLWFSAADQSSDRIYFAICTAFVTFFLIRYGKVFMWRKIGRELIKVSEEQLIIKNAFGKYGKAQIFATDNIRKFGLIPYDFTKFGQFMDRAFWEMGGETLGFDYFNKKIRFGKQLDDREAKQLARIIDKALAEIPARHRRKQKEEA